MQKLSMGLVLACALTGVLTGVLSAGALAGDKKKSAEELKKIATRSEAFLACAELPIKVSADGEGDVISYKCTSQFGPTMWMVIQEGTRFSFGFGKKANTPQTAAGDAEGAIEWWGKVEKGKFVPATVIKRFTFSDYGEPEKRTQQLVVFRLLRDGKSCVLAVLDSSKTENAEARKIALSDGKCLS